MNKQELDKTLIMVSIFAVILLSSLLFFFPHTLERLASLLFNQVTTSIGWLVQLLGFACVVAVIFISCSKYGDIKLGEGPPIYSNISWIFMFICAGLGSATMYWAFVEWGYYFNAPGLNIDPKSNEALRASLSYSFFHWGLTPWSIYAISSLAMSYHFYINKSKGLSLSSLISSITKIKSPYLSKSIDCIFLFATFGGLVLTTTLSIATISSGLSKLFDLSNAFALKALLLTFVTLTFSLSSYIGIEGGMQKLAKVAVGMTLLFASIVLLLGNTVFIIDNFMNSLGFMLGNFVRMSLFADPLGESSFNRDWTVFYWLYWITYTPGVSIFVTRVSRGRSIKEMMLALVIGGSFGCWFFFSCLSGYALDLFIQNVIDIPSLLTLNVGEEAVGLILSTLPFSLILSLFYFLLMAVFLASHLDATAYTIAAVSTKNLVSGIDPKRSLRLFWCVMLGLIPLAMLYINASLSTLKTAVIITAVPFILILFICMYALIKWFKNYPKEQL